MSLITRTYTFTDGTTAYGSQVDSEIANIVNTLNNLDSGTTTWTNVKVTTLSPQANIAMGNHKLTGLLAGSTTGDSVSYEQVNGYLVPTGAVLPYCSSSAPSGWLTCDGSAVSRTTYSALFAVISTTFGNGDGSTTFNVPDFRRRVAVGSGGSGTGTLGATIGSTGGEETHTLTTSEMPVHNHGITDPGHAHQQTVNTANGVNSHASFDGGNNNGAAAAVVGTNTQSSTTGITTNNAGSGSAHNNIQPSIVINYIIRT